jgi:hypothetical protein
LINKLELIALDFYRAKKIIQIEIIRISKRNRLTDDKKYDLRVKDLKNPF